MNSDQVEQTRRTLKNMNDAADQAIDWQVSRLPAGSHDQVTETRRTLKEMNEAADRAIDEQVARSTPMAPKK